MKILYQGVPGAYSNLSSIKARELLGLDGSVDIIGMQDFISIWEQIDENHIGILPIENSRAGSIHENIYNFLKYDFKVVGEISLKVNHNLLSLENDIDNIKEVYSHPQALSQCSNYLKSKNIKPISFYDTAGSAKMIFETQKKGVGAIASSLAGEIYGLNKLDEKIQDQDGNTTRFFIVTSKKSNLEVKQKKAKLALVFESVNIPSSLYKCLGAFATNGVNLTKIESMPSYKDPFSYMFYLELEGKKSDKNIISAFEELDFFTSFYKILGEY